MAIASEPHHAELFPLPDKASTWLVYALLLVALTALFYGHTRHHLLALDDANMFADNLAFDRDFAHFFAPAEERAHGSGRPFTELVKYLAFKVWGHHIPAYHLLVVGAHACCALLLAFCASRLGSPPDLSLLTGLLFLANVSHSGALHWLSALDYPLAAIWSLTIVLCYIRGEVGSWRWLLALHLALLCGLLSHIAVAFVAPFCLYWSWLQGRPLLAAVGRLAPGALSLAFAAAVAVYTTQRRNTSSFVYDRLADGSTGGLAVDLGAAWLWLLGRLVSTAHWLSLRPDEQYDWELLLGGVLLLALLSSVCSGRSPHNLWSAWTLLALLPFVPATLVPTGIARYLYAPAMGVAGLLAWGLYRLCAGLERRRPAAGRAVCVVALALLLASSHVAIQRGSNVSTYASARYYLAHGEVETGVRLMRQALATDPDVIDLSNAYLSLLTYLIASNRPFAEDLQRAQRAIPDDDNVRTIAVAVGLLDDDPEVVARSRRSFEDFNSSLDGERRQILWHLTKTILRNLGHRATRAGEPALAVRAYQQALLFDDERVGTLFYLAGALLEAGAPEDAEVVAREILAADHHDESAHLILAQAAKDRGDREEALRICTERMRVGAEPNFFFLAADLLWEQGEYERALGYFEAGIALAPQPDRYLQWTAALRALGRIDDAVARIEEGLRLQPTHSGMLCESGNLYLAAGRPAEADRAYRQVLQIDPEHAEAKAGLGGLSRDRPGY